MIAGELQANKELASAAFNARVIPSVAYTAPQVANEMSADAVDIGKTIHTHPTLGESIGMAAEVAHGSCTDMPPGKK